MARIETDVLVAGGGVAGLTAAAAFAAAGFRVVCVDPVPPVTSAEAEGSDLRSTAFLLPAVALLGRAGLWERLEPHAAALRVMRIADAGGADGAIRETADFEAREIGQDAFGYNLPNWLLRREMVARLAELPGAELRAGASVVRVTPRTDAALAALSDGAQVRAALVVAADGRDSAVREALGIGVRRWGYGQKALVFSVTHPVPHAGVSIEIHRSGGPFTLVPLRDRDGAPASAVVWMETGPRAAALAAMPEGAFEAALNDRAAGVFGELRLASPRRLWPIVAQVAARLAGPRAALVAEAAHVVPPIGAQGLNMSLRDIVTLVDLCVAARDAGRDIGAPDLLARYQRARYGDVLLRMAGLDALNRAAMAGARPLRDLRRAGLLALHGIAPVRRAAMRLGLGDGLGEDSGRVNDSDSSALPALSGVKPRAARPLAPASPPPYADAMQQPDHQRLLIVDFGSQVTQLIARRLREARIYCEIHPYQKVDAAFLAGFRPRAVILSGGPASVTEAASPRAAPEIFGLGVPVLGICYGQQVMMQQLGGRVEAGHHAEFGRAFVTPTETHDPLFTGLFATGREEVWMSHGDRVTALAPGFSVIGTSPNAPFAITTDPGRHFYAVQFHPEVHHTVNGARILKNFTDLAGFTGDWTMATYKEQAIAAIRAKVGGEKVICGLSGGVDSSVAAVLIHEAIGEQLTCVFVDTGLMRQGEAEEVVTLFRDHYNIPLIHADESDRFLDALEGVEDPEAKRKTIGRLFVEVFEARAAEVGDAAFLAQGTLYPDVIESVSFSGGPSATIKSHHNVGGLPERMKLKLVEPLRELFKDEVRALGRELGLPESFVGRHPFPGPGLAIRCPGAITRDKLAILRKADAVYLDQIRRHGLYDAIWQAFAVLLPVRSVGVMGDGRTYDYVCALRAVTSVDGMTADYYPFDHVFLGETATRIINEVKGINRVTYDITSKPPGTIEWE